MKKKPIDISNINASLLSAKLLQYGPLSYAENVRNVI